MMGRPLPVASLCFRGRQVSGRDYCAIPDEFELSLFADSRSLRTAAARVRKNTRHVPGAAALPRGEPRSARRVNLPA